MKQLKALPIIIASVFLFALHAEDQETRKGRVSPLGQTENLAKIKIDVNNTQFRVPSDRDYQLRFDTLHTGKNQASVDSGCLIEVDSSKDPDIIVKVDPNVDPDMITEIPPKPGVVILKKDTLK